MYDLAIIVALNDNAKLSAEQRAEYEARKRESRDRFWAARNEGSLREDAREVAQLYSDAPRLAAVEQLCLAFALAILEHGVDGPPVFPVRHTR